MTGKKANVARRFLTGDMRFAEFAVTNRCVAKCSFCGIWQQQPKVTSDREKSLQVIDNLADMGVVHITLTGGEPLLHPDIVDFVARCTDRGVHTSVLDATPSLVTDDKLARLEAAGADMISISFDSDDPKVLEESRQIPGIMADMEKTVARIGRTKVKSMASILIWNNNHDRMEQMFERAVAMGFDMISVNYPTFSESVIYPLGGEGISLSRDLVIESLESVIELKQATRYPIVNQVTSMRNIIDYLRDPASAKHHCLGGHRVMFVDWHFDVRPCMQLPDVLGNMLTMTKADLKKVPCNRCNMSWYRDFSVFFTGVEPLATYGELMRSGGMM
ncbi:MAG: radical SAM protein [Actinobacteria bacterium]|nr:MAG: radical SAM protein [Actinomycetota bacterium]